jgi:multiple sugar transport system permease protein
MNAIAKLFESRRLGEMSPAQKTLVYTALAVWTVVVFFPLYWVTITSLKEPGDVANGPFYLPFVDYQPSLSAWRYVLEETGRDTLRPYLNSIIIAICSTGLAAMIGSMAAYALTRIQYQPRWSSILLFIASVALTVVLVTAAGVSPMWSMGAGVMAFVLLVRPLARRFTAHLGQQRRPVLDDLPAHPSAGGCSHPDLCDVPASRPARHAFRPGRDVHVGEPANRRLADV